MQMQNRTTILDPETPPLATHFGETATTPIVTTGLGTPGTTTAPATWREPLLRGVLAIAVGIALLFLPITAAYVAAIAFGVYVLVDGAFTIVQAMKAANPEAGRWWTMLARGILGVVVGLFAILFPTAAAAALGTLIAIWAIFAGALEMAAGFRVRHDAGREAMLIGLGAITIVLGVVLLFVPILALVAQIYVFAAYAIIAGIGLVSYAMRLRKRTALLAR